MGKRGLLRTLSITGIVALVAAPFALPAQADTTEVLVSNSAWYWETQKSQPITDPTSGADLVTIEAPNPFCPSTSAGGPPEQSGACKAGRLPVEVQNSDYETPDKISAVSFDFALIPIGSEVQSFTATFLEADDPQSEPFNAEDKQLQACLVEQFFGDGDGRQYKEAPRYNCEPSDPIAKRKTIKVKDEEGNKVERFAWTFDLTSHAQMWAEGEVPVAAIMLFPVKPKNVDPSTDSNWRVVMSGAQEDNGVSTKLVYTPAELAPLPGTDDALGGDTGFDTGSTSSGFDTGGSDFGSGTSGSTEVPDSGAEESGDTGEPVVAAEGDPASEVLPTAGGLPGYVWLALLIGLIGFSFVRQVVLESATGVRPDGVLAQIRKINSDRRGVAIDEMTSSAGAGPSVIEGLKGLGGKASGLLSKLPFKRKG